MSNSFDQSDKSTGSGCQQLDEKLVLRALNDSEEQFIAKYNISKKELIQSRVDPVEVENICKSYAERTPRLLALGKMVEEVLRSREVGHSLKMRIKSINSLVHKIVRKQIENTSLCLTATNYENNITDLIGIRILHLYKTDWARIHDCIINTWETAEKPFAYIRRGDDEQVFKSKNCNVEVHDVGYRSVHYLVKVKPDKEEAIVEIQVRTIFEEGWSEIDHHIRYPSHKRNDIIQEYLTIFNRLAGSADEMGTFILTLRKYLEEQERVKTTIEHERDNKKKELDEVVNNLKLSNAEKKELEDKINELHKGSLDYWRTSLSSVFPSLDTQEKIGGLGCLFNNGDEHITGNSWIGDKCSVCGKYLFHGICMVPSDGLCDECRVLYGHNYLKGLKCSQCGKIIPDDPLLEYSGDKLCELCKATK